MYMYRFWNNARKSDNSQSAVVEVIRVCEGFAGESPCLDSGRPDYEDGGGPVFPCGAPSFTLEGPGLADGEPASVVFFRLCILSSHWSEATSQCYSGKLLRLWSEITSSAAHWMSLLT